MESIALTPENVESITKLAALIGWTPDKLANHLLTETLEEFADGFSGSLEGFLGAIYYPDRASAQRALDRVTQMTKQVSGGRLPDSFKSKVFQYPAVRSISGSSTKNQLGPRRSNPDRERVNPSQHRLGQGTDQTP
jgi:hypothetical protein